VALLAVGLRAAVSLGRRVRASIPDRSGRAADRALLAEASRPDSTVVGVDERGLPITLREEHLRSHGLVVGASGAGKSTTMLALLDAQIERGHPVVAIDLKGSPSFAESLRRSAAAAGRRFRVWSLYGSEHWNPLAAGNATELKDKLIATERFSEPHYRRAAERYVQTALQVLEQTRPQVPPSLRRVGELLDPKQLALAARELAPEQAERVGLYLRSLTPDQHSAVRGLASRLAVISESHTGPLLEPAPGAIDLRETLASDGVVLFSLNSSTYGGLAAQLGSVAVQDLISAAGNRLTRSATGQPPLAFVAIDEFSALHSDNVLGLLARGREAGVSVLLATQELADLDRAGRGMREQVIGNVGLVIGHRQNVPESAQAIARMSGKVREWQLSYSQRPDGGLSTSAREIERDAVPAQRIQSLASGEAQVTVKTPSSRTSVGRILPRSRWRERGGAER
jgi:DNA helicase HerA-like ATPase